MKRGCLDLMVGEMGQGKRRLTRATDGLDINEGINLERTEEVQIQSRRDDQIHLGLSSPLISSMASPSKPRK